MRRGECIGRETWVNINRVEEDRILQTRVREFRGMVAKERDNSQMRTHTCKSKMWQDKCRKSRKVGKSIKG